MDYFELIETFPSRGCAICKLLRRDIDRTIDGMVYGFMDTDEMRAAFRASRGLCSEHGWLLKQNKFGNVLGIAKLYAATLDEVLDIIDRAPLIESAPSTLDRFLGNTGRKSPLADQLEAEAACMVCSRIDEREADYAAIFAQYLLDERFHTAFSASDGICLPHFRLLLRQISSPDSCRILIRTQKEIWTRLKAEVESFASKQNYERIDELNQDEADSWARAIGAMGGEKGIFGMRRKPG
jgi:hypothetical protein